MRSEPRVELELPRVGELVQDEPGTEVGAAEIQLALDPGDVRLDEVEGAGARRGAGIVLERQHRVVLPEDAPGHEAEQLADVAVQHPPAHPGRERLGHPGSKALDGREQPLHHREVGVDEARPVERDEPRIPRQGDLADLGHQRRDPGGHLRVRGLEGRCLDARPSGDIAGP